VPLHSDSLNRGDVFILDNGSKIWVWCGAESNRSERRKVSLFYKFFNVLTPKLQLNALLVIYARINLTLNLYSILEN